MKQPYKTIQEAEDTARRAIEVPWAVEAQAEVKVEKSRANAWTEVEHNAVRIFVQGAHVASAIDFKADGGVRTNIRDKDGVWVQGWTDTWTIPVLHAALRVVLEDIEVYR